jgi:hypothetical protein
MQRKQATSADPFDGAESRRKNECQTKDVFPKSAANLAVILLKKGE